MILMLSGEGKTDMGQMVPADRGMRFQPGPMAWVFDRLVAKYLYHSPIEVYEAGGESVCFVSETELAYSGKQSSPTLLAGIKFGKGLAGYARNAQVLGLRAISLQNEKSEPVVAVLFRDTDKTNAAPRSEWQTKVESMRRGFDIVGFSRGVPMMPLPKSEAWLLCALKQNHYQDCEKLEEAPGNDNSPNSLKKQLENVIGHEAAAEEQADWVRSGRVDPQRIDMPSFNAFRGALNDAINTL